MKLPSFLLWQEGKLMIHVAVTSDPIDTIAVMARVGADDHGAALLFLGVVRNHADGRSVSGMTYEAYEEMATPVLKEIASEVVKRCGTDRVTIVHRVGELAIGEVSVAIAVSSPHRAEAYEASRYVIEEIKKRLPIWKKEHYTDGTDKWVEGMKPTAPERAGSLAERPI